MAKSFTCWRLPERKRTAAIESWTYTPLTAAESAARSPVQAPPECAGVLQLDDRAAEGRMVSDVDDGRRRPGDNRDIFFGCHHPPTSRPHEQGGRRTKRGRTALSSPPVNGSDPGF